MTNSSMYNLLCSVRDGTYWSSSPGGLSDDGYNGHAFWDVETWIWPNLLMFHPGIAQSVLQYRYNVRDGAHRLAQHNGYPGIQFPWESAYTGYEVDGWLPSTLEIHVEGDIAFAYHQYWQATQNKTWLADIAFPVLHNLSTWWASRVTPDGSQYSINHAMGPDEHHGNISNSVYVNVVAGLTFQFAIEAATVLGLQDTIPANWSHIAENLVVLFDEAAVPPGVPGLRRAERQAGRRDLAWLPADVQHEHCGPRERLELLPDKDPRRAGNDVGHVCDWISRGGKFVRRQRTLGPVLRPVHVW